MAVFGLTRQEAAFVLLMAVVTLAGALVPAVRSWWSPRETAGEMFLRIDSSLVLDSARVDGHRNWAQRRDSLMQLLHAGAPASEVDSFVQRSADTPVTVVHINEAGSHELASLPGIGPKLAERIVEYRNQHGPFRRTEDIQRVKGIGKKMFEKIKPFVDIK